MYIFMNENGSFQNVSTKVLKGPAYSGFGFAVAAIGDVNQDGFQGAVLIKQCLIWLSRGLIFVFPCVASADFAVGAPFQETGRVYIWMGSKKGISDKYSQVISICVFFFFFFRTFFSNSIYKLIHYLLQMIEGKSVGDGNFQSFGYSIDGGMDMDGNSYPDMVVGSLDDRIALIR